MGVKDYIVVKKSKHQFLYDPVDLEGKTIIDNKWFKNIVYDNGKVNTNAILVLSDILIQDTETDGYIQVSYKLIANKFNLSKRQVQDAYYYLGFTNLIKIELRTIISDGVKIANVVYVKPILENINAISDDEYEFS